MKWNWLKQTKDIFNNGLHEIHNFNINDIRNSCIVESVIKDLDKHNLFESAMEKPSLSTYLKLKSYHQGITFLYTGMEKYLLDKLDFKGVNLKFRARSNTLQLNTKTCKWSNEVDETCPLCHSGIEDISHFLFICRNTQINNIRIDEFCKLENKLSKEFNLQNV